MNQVALATALGNMVPYYGVISGEDGTMRCECRYINKCTARGKHPRLGVGFKKYLTQDMGQIMAWSIQYPETNFGMTALPHVFAIDFDCRPEDGKYGKEELALIKGYNQKDMDETIRVTSGRDWLVDYLTIKREVSLARQQRRERR